MALRTLADVRGLMRHLPEDRRGGTPGATSPRNSSKRPPAPTQSTSPVALRMALMLDNVECRPT